MAQAQINFRIDEEIKKEAEKTLEEIGLNMSAAVTIFLRTVAREKRIPFELAAYPVCGKNPENKD